MDGSVDRVVDDEAMDSAIAAWRGDPSDRLAFAGFRSEFLVRYAGAVQSGAPGIGQLGRAASNLIDRLREGTVDPNEAVVDALADVAGRMGAPVRTRADPSVAETIERLDAYASGLTDLEFDTPRPGGESVRREPPLLTIRHDGVRLKPGSFEASADVGETRTGELSILGDAWEAIGDRIRGQVESLRDVADGNADPDLRRSVTALQGVVDNIERLNRIFAAYVRRVGE